MFLYFILGILFIVCFYPIIDSITGIIITFLELIKSTITLKITQINYQIQSLIDSEENAPSKNHAIGFTASFEQEEEESDEDL